MGGTGVTTTRNRSPLRQVECTAPGSRTASVGGAEGRRCPPAFSVHIALAVPDAGRWLGRQRVAGSTVNQQANAPAPGWGLVLSGGVLLRLVGHCRARIALPSATAHQPAHRQPPLQRAATRPPGTLPPAQRHQHPPLSGFLGFSALSGSCGRPLLSARHWQVAHAAQGHDLGVGAHRLLAQPVHHLPPRRRLLVRVWQTCVRSSSLLTTPVTRHQRSSSSGCGSSSGKASLARTRRCPARGTSARSATAYRRAPRGATGGRSPSFPVRPRSNEAGQVVVGSGLQTAAQSWEAAARRPSMRVTAGVVPAAVFAGAAAPPARPGQRRQVERRDSRSERGAPHVWGLPCPSQHDTLEPTRRQACGSGRQPDQNRPRPAAGHPPIRAACDCRPLCFYGRAMKAKGRFVPSAADALYGNSSLGIRRARARVRFGPRLSGACRKDLATAGSCAGPVHGAARPALTSPCAAMVRWWAGRLRWPCSRNVIDHLPPEVRSILLGWVGAPTARQPAAVLANQCVPMEGGRTTGARRLSGVVRASQPAPSICARRRPPQPLVAGPLASWLLNRFFKRLEVSPQKARRWRCWIHSKPRGLLFVRTLALQQQSPPSWMRRQTAAAHHLRAAPRATLRTTPANALPGDGGSGAT